MGSKKQQKLQKKWKVVFSTKIFVLTILNGIWEVWGCPGAWHGPYEAIPSNFGGIWSYMAWGKSIFMFFGNIGNSLHHQIPPNWSSGLQIGPRIFWGVRAPNKTNYFQKNDPTNIYFPGTWTTSQNLHFLTKWLPVFLSLLGPSWPGSLGYQ